jgi:hypothetical protein
MKDRETAESGILSPVCLPFHHSGLCCYIATCENIASRVLTLRHFLHHCCFVKTDAPAGKDKVRGLGRHREASYQKVLDGRKLPINQPKVMSMEQGMLQTTSYWGNIRTI